MKAHFKLITLCLLLSTLGLTARAQGTAFTYQGRLNDASGPASGSYDLTFSLFYTNASGVSVAGPVTNNATVVSNGLFVTAIDFGAGVFNGTNCWLELGVRTNGSAVPFAILTPRQPLTPVPYALYALTPVGPQGVAGLNGTNGLNGINGTNGLNGLNGTNGATGPQGLPGSANAWSLGGSTGTTPGVNFIGTADNQPLEVKVNSTRALRLEPTTDTPNLIGGSSANFVQSLVVGATIGGGGAAGMTAGLFPNTNQVTDDYGTVGGGYGNRAGNSNGSHTDAPYATVGGGFENNVVAQYGTISGGQNNGVSGDNGFVGGGLHNTANREAAIGAGTYNSANGSDSFIGSGGHNTVDGGSAAIGGGLYNSASGNWSAIPGGSYNVAAGINSLAAGLQAKANHNGAFVWADSVGVDFASTATNQFLIRAGGGVGINTNNPGTNALRVVGTVAADNFSGSGAGLTGLSGAAIANGSITSAQLANGVAVTSLNNLSNAVTLAAGANVTLTPSGNTITIAATGGGGGGSTGWNTNGNAGTDPANGYFLGTTDNQALELKVNNARALRLEPNTNGAPNVIGGSSVNFAAPDVAGVTIAGGGATNYSGHYYTNSVASYFGTISGGNWNTIQSNAISSTIGGGALNTVFTNAFYGTIGGGSGNKVTGSFGTVPGGSSNTATNNSFAAGTQAKANHSGTFVWSDNSTTIPAFASTGTNQFLIRAVGGVGIGTNNPGTNALAVAGSVAATTFIGDGSQLTGIVGGVSSVTAAAPLASSGGATPQISLTGTVPLANLPGAVLTNNQSGVTLGGTFIGSLNGNATTATSATSAGTATTATTANNFTGTLAGDVTGLQGATVVSANIPRLNGTNLFTGTNTFAGVVNLTNTANVFAGSGAGLTGLSGAAIANGSIANAQLANNAVNAGNIASGQVVKSVDGLYDAVSIVAGANVTLATNIGTSTLTISAVGGGGGSGNGWNTNGNTGTDPANGYFLGTTDNHALELKVNGTRGLRLEPTADATAVNVIGGSRSNFVAPGVIAATIGGGGVDTLTPLYLLGLSGGGGFLNQVSNSVAADVATISGGAANRVGTASVGAAVGGGVGNSIESYASFATIAGGIQNAIRTNAYQATIGGGFLNEIQTNAYRAVIAGGELNSIQTNSDHSVIGGGQNNTIQANSSYSFIGGGLNNTNNNCIASAIGGGQLNLIDANAGYAVIGGGFFNTILSPNPLISFYSCSVISGGQRNFIRGYGSVISGGGYVGTAYLSFDFTSNSIFGDYSFIGGGIRNKITGNGNTISGGDSNTVSASYAMIPGGDQNVAGGQNSFAAGHRAKANHQGSFVWADANNADFATTANNQFLIRAGGGVGINTANIFGSGGLSVGGTAPLFHLGNTVNEGWSLEKADTPPSPADGRFRIYEDDLGQLGEWFTILKGGRVGINTGTTGPQQQLEVGGRIRMDSWTADGTVAVYKNANGDFALQLSDARLKKNVQTISNALETVAGLRGVTFNWLSQPDDAPKTVGLIAQEVRAVIPELTYEFKGEDGETYYGVHYEKVAAVLANAVQEQQTQIGRQQAEIKALQTRLERLEQLMTEKTGGAK